MTAKSEELAGSAKHYASPEELPEWSAKYFYQRYDLFSKYNSGILMTPEAFFEVTPEIVADAIAYDIQDFKTDGKKTIIDCFAGVGGNTIAFARCEKISRVFAIERDPAKMKCLKHNLKIYGVDKKVFPVQGDVFKVLSRYKSMGPEAIIFASPPWGGPNYSASDVFDLSTMEPYNLSKLVDAAHKITPEFVLFLPRNSDLNQIASHNTSDKSMPTIHYCLKGASKALVVYFGSWKG